jgi:hypothetical protein
MFYVWYTLYYLWMSTIPCITCGCPLYLVLPVDVHYTLYYLWMSTKIAITTSFCYYFVKLFNS